MKIEREKSKETKEFKPVTLIITIESKEELFNLLQRMSVTDTDINENLEIKGEASMFSYGDPFYECDSVNMDLWQEIDSIVDLKKQTGEIL